MKTFEIIKNEVQAMKDVQSKPTEIYLGVLVTVFAVIMFMYGYFTGYAGAKFDNDKKNEEK